MSSRRKMYSTPQRILLIAAIVLVHTSAVHSVDQHPQSEDLSNAKPQAQSSWSSYIPFWNSKSDKPPRSILKKPTTAPQIEIDPENPFIESAQASHDIESIDSYDALASEFEFWELPSLFSTRKGVRWADAYDGSVVDKLMHAAHGLPSLKQNTREIENKTPEDFSQLSDFERRNASMMINQWMESIYDLVQSNPIKQKDLQRVHMSIFPKKPSITGYLPPSYKTVFKDLIQSIGYLHRHVAALFLKEDTIHPEGAREPLFSVAMRKLQSFVFYCQRLLQVRAYRLSLYTVPTVHLEPEDDKDRSNWNKNYNNPLVLNEYLKSRTLSNGYGAAASKKQMDGLYQSADAIAETLNSLWTQELQSLGKLMIKNLKETQLKTQEIMLQKAQALSPEYETLLQENLISYSPTIRSETYEILSTFYDDVEELLNNAEIDEDGFKEKYISAMTLSIHYLFNVLEKPEDIGQISNKLRSYQLDKEGLKDAIGKLLKLRRLQHSEDGENAAAKAYRSATLKTIVITDFWTSCTKVLQLSVSTTRFLHEDEVILDEPSHILYDKLSKTEIMLNENEKLEWADARDDAFHYSLIQMFMANLRFGLEEILSLDLVEQAGDAQKSGDAQ